MFMPRMQRVMRAGRRHGDTGVFGSDIVINDYTRSVIRQQILGHVTELRKAKEEHKTAQDHADELQVVVDRCRTRLQELRRSIGDEEDTE